MNGSFSDEARAAIGATLVEVWEASPLWSFSGSIVVRQQRVDVGWPFASWAIGEWLKCGFVRLMSHDWWSSNSMPAPGWAERASLDGGVYVLALDDALELAADIRRWRSDVDGIIEVVPAPTMPEETEEWIRRLAVSPVAHPAIGPDLVSRAQARASASVDISELNRWFIFPPHDPTDDR
ncbi:hypothetical protein [Herbiconiux sp. UC225_62]|uniref:hypothetical protein n=1 Tax=Herbiconiux sp. UC225_62 TaxID=3350168 RepID=UPI0036D3F402